MYCPACPQKCLNPTQNNTEAVDFNCLNCGSLFQLKSTKNPFGRKITDAAYDSMMRAILNDKLPHLFVLRYALPQVTDLLLIPSFSFSTSAIEARKPLSKSARRAGWVGCNIILDFIPPENRICIVREGNVISRSEVRKQFQSALPLSKIKAKKRGWTIDVWNGLRSLGKSIFTIQDAYSLETIFQDLHPENKHIRPKIRQQLQVLRDLGCIDFISKGVYRWKRNVKSN